MTVQVTDVLGVKPKSIRGYMKRHKGDFIYAGDTIAANDNQMRKAVISEYTGTLTDIDPKKGTVTICYNKEPYRLFSHFYGNVRSVSDNRYIDLDYHGHNFTGKIGFGAINSGKLRHNPSHKSFENLEGLVIFANQSPDLHILNQYAKSKISGLVVPSIEYEVLKQFLQKDLGVALTGNENIPFTLIITEGFGKRLFSQKTEMILTEYESHYCVVNGHTQIRAGVIRPNIIIM